MNPLERIGVVKTTLIDYPGRVAAALYIPGCNLRCPYCHNPRLVDGSPPNDLSTYQEALEFLKKRRPLLGGVCVSGGEPSLRTDLQDVVKDIQAIGLPVKIDTNGTRPDVLRTITADFIAMDIKTSLERYHELAYDSMLKQTIRDRVEESISYIIKSGIPHEFRTTVAPGIAGPEEIEKITDLIRGADHYVLAEFHSGETLDPDYHGTPSYSREQLYMMRDIGTSKGISVTLRLNH